MTETESQILTLLKQSPKTWRELLPSFPDQKDDMNRALMKLDAAGKIRYDVSTGCYRIKPVE